jgi:hypothetical protein
MIYFILVAVSINCLIWCSSFDMFVVHVLSYDGISSTLGLVRLAWNHCLE